MEWSEETDRYRLHDLARVFADSRLSEPERLVHQQCHAEHYMQVLYESQRLYGQFGETIKLGVDLFDREWSNAQAGWEWAISHAGTISRALELCSEYPGRWALIAEFRHHPSERAIRLEKALLAAQKLGRKNDQVDHLCNLGIAYLDLGETQRAIVLYKQSLSLCHEIGDREGEGHVLGNLGGAYSALGKTRRAIKFYKQCLSVAREVGDRRSEGITLRNLGNIYSNSYKTRRAIEFYEQSLSISREIGDRVGEADTLRLIGNAYINGVDDNGFHFYDLNKTRRAIEFYEQDLAIAREIGDRRRECNALWDTALAMEEMEDYTQTIVYAKAALVICEEIESPSAAMIRKQLESWQRIEKCRSK